MIEGNVFQSPNLRLLRLITLLGDSFVCYNVAPRSNGSASSSLTAFLSVPCLLLTSIFPSRFSILGSKVNLILQNLPGGCSTEGR